MLKDADGSLQVQNPRHGIMSKSFPSTDDMVTWSKGSDKLSSFKVSILRATSFGSVEWKMEGGKWTGSVEEGKGVAPAP